MQSSVSEEQLVSREDFGPEPRCCCNRFGIVAAVKLLAYLHGLVTVGGCLLFIFISFTSERLYLVPMLLAFLVLGALTAWWMLKAVGSGKRRYLLPYLIYGGVMIAVGSLQWLYGVTVNLYVLGNFEGVSAPVMWESVALLSVSLPLSVWFWRTVYRCHEYLAARWLMRAIDLVVSEQLYAGATNNRMNIA